MTVSGGIPATNQMLVVSSKDVKPTTQHWAATVRAATRAATHASRLQIGTALKQTIKLFYAVEAMVTRSHVFATHCLLHSRSACRGEPCKLFDKFMCDVLAC